MKKHSFLIIGLLAGISLMIDCSKLAENTTGPETVKCEVCHMVPPADSMHRGMDSSLSGCSVCHKGITVRGTAITLDNTHDNGKIDYRCDACHDFPPADTYHKAVSKTTVNCDLCHSGVLIKNGIILALPATHGKDNGVPLIKRCDVCHGFPPSGGSHAGSSATRVNCDSCHSRVSVTNGAISIREDHGKGPITCAVCHAVPPNDGKHDTTKKFNCDSCHFGITIKNKTYTLDSSTHNNGIVNIACTLCHAYPPKNRFHDTTNKTNCADCHLGITITNGVVYHTALHDNGQIDMKVCNVCHDFPPSGNSHASSGPTHVNCDSCHTRVVVSSPTAIPTLTPGHDQGPIKCAVCHAVPPNDGTHDTTHTFNCDSCHTGITIGNNSYTLDGSTHDNGTVNFKRCDLCHSLPPTGGIHPYHVTSKGYNCTVCHNGFNATTTPPTPAPYHRGDTVVKFSDYFSLASRGAVYDRSAQNCSAVYCHGNFPDGTDRTIGIDSTNAIGCGWCHDTASMFALGHPRTDTATWHRHTNTYVLQHCGNCHYGYSISPPVKAVDSLHVNGKYNVVVTNKQNVATPLTQPNGTAKHCSTACH